MNYHQSRVSLHSPYVCLLHSLHNYHSSIINMNTFTSPQGVPMREVRELSAVFHVHPRHVSFIIGPKGANIKNMCRKSGAYIRIENPRNNTSNEFPWFKITANTIRAVELGYQLVREEANMADHKLPLMNHHTHTHTHKPSTHTHIATHTPTARVTHTPPHTPPHSPSYSPPNTPEPASTSTVKKGKKPFRRKDNVPQQK